jgi:hypothetical protein
MGGFIRKSECWKERREICRLFGTKFWVHCMLAPKGSTFLGMLAKHQKI